jgi:hypothetical protein
MVESLPIESSWASFRCAFQGNFSARLYYLASVKKQEHVEEAVSLEV